MAELEHQEQIDAIMSRATDIDPDTIRQLRVANRDKRTCSLLLYLVFITAPVTLPLLILSIRKERRLVREIAATVGIPGDWPYGDLSTAVALVIEEAEIARQGRSSH